MNARKTILVSWDTTRSDLMVPFSDLKNHFRFVFVTERGAKVDESYSEFEIIYYEDYLSPKRVLDVNPSFCIFMSVVSFYDISLNYFLIRNGIPTAILQHGYYAGDVAEELEYLKLKETKGPKNTNFQVKNKNRDLFKKIGFYTLSLGLLDMMKGWLFYYKQFKYGFWNVYLSETIKFRKPTYILAISEGNSRIHIQKDYADENNIFYFGNFMAPAFNEPAFKEQKALTGRRREQGNSSILFFDSPYAERAIFGSPEGYYAYLKKLAELMPETTVTLKLHPINYRRASKFQEIVPEWHIVRDCDWAGLTSKCTAVLSFQSSVLMPTKQINGNILLLCNDIGNLSSLEIKLIDSGSFDFIEAKKVTSRSISEFLEGQSKNITSRFESEFLYKNDGKAKDRLKEFLINH